MFVNKVKLLIFASHFFLKSHGLEKIDSKEDIILETEAILRNTTNKLFLGLNLNKQVRPKIKQALLVHKFFTSVTLKDHNTLNLIIKISRVNKHKVDNDIGRCMDLINEILNEDWNGADVNSLANNEGIIEYVDEFLNNLNGFKENSGYNDDYDKLDIKDEILHILKSDNPSEFNLSLNQNQTTPNFEEDDGFLSDNEFWAPQPTRRIYRGDRTKIKYFPFMASIQIFKNFQCAGSIIKSDLIITAASCLQLAWNNRFFRENPAFLSVRVGSNFYNGGGEDIPILEVYFHPSYNPKNLRNNIAVLRLLRHLKFRKHKRRLKKINIDKEDTPLSMTTDGITIVGWGARGSSNIVRDPWSNQLAFAVLDVYHLQECQEIYSREYVTRTNFCAGFVSKGGGACNHDVGGPGVVNGILTGIISFGSPVCGTPDAPTVFTKVGYYADWIEEIMEQDVPTVRRKTTLSYPPPPPSTPSNVHFVPTTFKILPLPKIKYKPVPFYASDALRLLEDEELFKQFLTTMFNSKEAGEYKGLLNEFPVKKSNDFEPEQVQEAIKAPETNVENVLTKNHLGTITGDVLSKIIRDKQIKTYQRNHELSKENHELVNPDNLIGLHELATDAGYHTAIGTYDNDREKGNRFTVVDVNMADGEEENNEAIEKNIMKLIDNIDLSGTNDKSAASETSEENAQEKMEDKNIEPAAIETKKRFEREQVGFTQLDMALVTDEPYTKTTQKNAKRKELRTLNRNNVLTLLYLSDNEKNNNTLEDIGNAIEDFDDNLSDGMPIDAGGFRDLTFRNNVTKNKSNSVLDFLSRNELYELLSEAIDEVSKHETTKKRSLLFSFPNIVRQYDPRNK